MLDIAIEQAAFRRDDNALPTLQSRSPGFQDERVREASRILVSFGIRWPGFAGAPLVFAQPLGVLHVAIVQVAAHGENALLYHVLLCQRTDYENFLGDPFALARQFPAPWDQPAMLPTLTVSRRLPPPRTVAQVDAILRRVKADALNEGEDPDHPDFERTATNSESPALLGGVQVLVDGGKLVFERPRPDPELVEALWTLLPQATRIRLWPATFAFANTLGFDVLVVPRVHVADFEGYTSEEQAANYPPGNYETALQIAAESGHQRDLDALLNRRTGSETFRLGWSLLGMVLFLALLPHLLDFWQPAPPPPVPTAKYEAAAAVGMVATGDPWTALALRIYGRMMWASQ